MTDQPDRYDAYWQNVEVAYPHYPTIRHRRRFIEHSLRTAGLRAEQSLFDYGCGEGSLLGWAVERFGLSAERVGGCDISRDAVDMAQRKLPSASLHAHPFPTLATTYDAIICSEVVEHTPAYPDILRWIHAHLGDGGALVLTTQTGPIHASDRYAGHTQHFSMNALCSQLDALGFDVVHRRAWGFPLFTLQKHLSNLAFDRVRTQYLEGRMTLRRRVVFGLAHASYFLHDLVPLGPQLYIVARRRHGSR